MSANETDANALSGDAIEALVAERPRFHRFLTMRLGNAADADDLLQESLLRALRGGDRLREAERLVPWFYRILRNSIADHFRRGGTSKRKLERLENELNISGRFAPPDWERILCACFAGLLPSLKPRYAEILRRVELGRESRQSRARPKALARHIPRGASPCT